MRNDVNAHVDSRISYALAGTRSKGGWGTGRTSTRRDRYPRRYLIKAVFSRMLMNQRHVDSQFGLGCEYPVGAAVDPSSMASVTAQSCRQRRTTVDGEADPMVLEMCHDDRRRPVLARVREVRA